MKSYILFNTLNPLILEANHIPSGVFYFSNPSHKFSPSFISSSIVIHFYYLYHVLVWFSLFPFSNFIWFSFPYSLILHLLASLSPYNCLFLLLWSEPSHLLNHLVKLVKFVSNEDLLRVLTIFLLKIPI